MENSVRFHIEMTKFQSDRLKKLSEKLSADLGMKVTRSAAIHIALNRAFKKEGV